MFFQIFNSIIPLYLIIFLGYIAGKSLKIEKQTITEILFYIITPIVTFSGILNVKFDPSLTLLPFLVFIISCLMCVIVQKLASLFAITNLRNILAFSSGSSNTGHFGLTVALAILDEETVGVYMVALVGVIIFENTYGFYIAAKGLHSRIYCLKKMLKLPSLYGAIFAMTLSHFDTSSSYAFLKTFFDNIRSSYIFLGMLLIGIGMGQLGKISFDWKCIGYVFFTRYFIWPALMFSIIFIDLQFLNFYGDTEHKALFILSILPMSVSTIVVASILKYPAEKIEITVILSTILGLIYVPAMVSILKL